MSAFLIDINPIFITNISSILYLYFDTLIIYIKYYYIIDYYQS